MTAQVLNATQLKWYVLILLVEPLTGCTLNHRHCVTKTQPFSHTIQRSYLSQIEQDGLDFANSIDPFDSSIGRQSFIESEANLVNQNYDQEAMQTETAVLPLLQFGCQPMLPTYMAPMALPTMALSTPSTSAAPQQYGSSTYHPSTTKDYIDSIGVPMPSAAVNIPTSQTAGPLNDLEFVQPQMMYNQLPEIEGSHIPTRTPVSVQQTDSKFKKSTGVDSMDATPVNLDFVDSKLPGSAHVATLTNDQGMQMPVLKMQCDANKGFKTLP